MQLDYLRFKVGAFEDGRQLEDYLNSQENEVYDVAALSFQQAMRSLVVIMEHRDARRSDETKIISRK